MSKHRLAYQGIIGVAVLSLAVAACSSTSSSNASSQGAATSTSSGQGATPGSSAPTAAGNSAPVANGKHFTIAYELGYVANNWQKEAENLVKATSKVAPYNKEVTLQVHISGQKVEAQISQVQQEIAAGVDAIILYPLSPTALSPVVKKACAKNIPVFTYDAFVNASCAYQISIPYKPSDPNSWGAVTAKWLANDLHGKGNVVMLSGVPGVSQDTWNVGSAKKEFKKFPGIKIIAQEPAKWNQAISKTKMAQILASHPDVDGIWNENGCYGSEEGVIEAHHALIPCAGNSSNGHRMMMLPKSEGGMGLQSISIGTGVHEGALALIDAVKLLQGGSLQHQITNPLGPLTVTNATVKLGVNVFKNKKVGGPGFMDDIHNSAIPPKADTVQAALTGNPSTS